MGSSHGFIQRVKRTKFFLPLFDYEYSKDIRRFPVGFRDPILKEKYVVYQRQKHLERLFYILIFLVPYTILLLATMFFGSRDLIPVKLGRLVTHWVFFTAAILLHESGRLSTNIVISIHFICIGVINVYFITSTGKEVSLTSDPSEIIGSENTTITYIIFMFLSNNQNYCMFVLTPIYLAINIAMLASVYDDIEETTGGKAKHIKAVSVIWRVIVIGAAMLYAQFMVVLQQTELFFKNRIVKVQQK